MFFQSLNLYIYLNQLYFDQVESDKNRYLIHKQDILIKKITKLYQILDKIDR